MVPGAWFFRIFSICLFPIYLHVTCTFVTWLKNDTVKTRATITKASKIMLMFVVAQSIAGLVLGILLAAGAYGN